MSQAFVRENEEQWLHEVTPTMSALIIHLTRENNGIRIYEKKNFIAKDDRVVHQMSNGLSYTKDKLGRWELL